MNLDLADPAAAAEALAEREAIVAEGASLDEVAPIVEAAPAEAKAATDAPPPEGGAPTDGEGDENHDEDGDDDETDAPLHDVSNAREFVERQGADFRHCKALGWLIYDGMRWAPCKRGEELQAAVATMEALYNESVAELKELAGQLKDALKARTGKELLKAIRREMAKVGRIVDHCAKSQKIERLRAMLAIAATDPKVAIDVADLDRDPWLLNVKNGTVDLRTGEMREHRRDDLLSFVAGASFDPAADSSLWLQTLHEVFAGDDCDEVIAYMQRLAGYSATGSTREEMFAVPHGSGRNGKNLVVETMMGALGDYAKAAPMSLFLESRGDGTRRFAIAEFRGTRMLVASEAADGNAFDVAALKSWTGDAERYAERKGKDPFKYVATDTLWLLLNDRPRVRSWDVAFEERIHLIPFEHSFTGARCDKTRKAGLRANLDGVLAWIVAGAVAWFRDGLQPPERVRAAVNDYRRESTHADEFVAERVRRSLGATVLQADVHTAYTAWARARGYTVVSDRKFAPYLERAGFTRKKVDRGQAIEDAVLLPEPKAEKVAP